MSGEMDARAVVSCMSLLPFPFRSLSFIFQSLPDTQAGPGLAGTGCHGEAEPECVSSARMSEGIRKEND